MQIKDGYLTPLVSGFLLGLASSVIAVYRRADFFTDEHAASIARIQQTLDQERQKHAGEIAQRDAERNQLKSSHQQLQSDVRRLSKENMELKDKVGRLDSVRNKIFAILGSSSVDEISMLSKLRLNNTGEEKEAMSVVGQLVQEGKIELDPNTVSSYRLKRTS